MHRAFVLLAIVVSAGCGSTTRNTAPVLAPAAPSAEAPRDPDSIRWVRDSAEYHAALSQVYRQVTARVEAAAASRSSGTWAVVLDADETVISNATYQLERARQGLGFTAESWNAWVKRREATPLPGVAALLARVRSLGGRIVIVTNRLQSECDDTAAVFKRHALVYDAMLCRQDGTPSDKNPRFQAVATGKSVAGSGPLEVVAFVGDNILDFPALNQAIRQQGDPAFAEFGVRFFLVPNPMYGSWQ